MSLPARRAKNHAEKIAEMFPSPQKLTESPEKKAESPQKKVEEEAKTP